MRGAAIFGGKTERALAAALIKMLLELSCAILNSSASNLTASSGAEFAAIEIS